MRPQVISHTSLVFLFNSDLSQIPEGAGGPLKAVMVFIHGGGFSSGSGTPEFYGPDYFLNEDVVLVTINYRLGALGEFSKGETF